jgi:hypothetical protein
MSAARVWSATWTNIAYNSNFNNPEYRKLRLMFLEWLEPHFRTLEFRTGHLTREKDLSRELKTLRRMKRMEEVWKDLKWFNRSTND